MRLCAFLLATVLVGVFPACADPRGTTSRSSQKQPLVPNFKLQNLAGKSVQLADFKGKVVLLDFWATWCGPCRLSIPNLINLHREYASQNLVILGINMDEDPQEVAAFVKDMGIDYPVLLDRGNAISASFGVRGIPFFCLIDQKGRLVKQWEGITFTIEKEWRQAIDQLLKK